MREEWEGWYIRADYRPSPRHRNARVLLGTAPSELDGRSWSHSEEGGADLSTVALPRLDRLRIVVGARKRPFSRFRL
jgi:hypothetical protein